MTPAKKPVKEYSAQDFLITTDLKLQLCRRCRAITAKGMSWGFEVVVDPWNLPDARAELEHRFHGGKTFNLLGEFNKLQVEPRQIQSLEDALNRPTGLVIGAHRCQEVGL